MKLTRYTLMLCFVAWASLPVSRAQGSDPNDIEKLRAKLVEQQKEIDALVQALKDQQKAIDALAKPATPAATPATPGLMASTTPMLSPAPVAAPRLLPPVPAATLDPQAAADQPAPLQFKLGNVTFTPIGFLDMTAVWRNKNAGSGIGSNFGSIPFDNAVPGGKLGEFRFSPQNSRVGMRIDGNWKGLQFLNYLEADFLGTSGANNIGVTNGAFVPRIRLWWLSARKGSWEFLGGQSWSMFTANRKGISALPGDLFYGQEFDVNYLIGMPWTRQPGFRVLYHGAENKWTWGLSAENPNQYMGGYGGGGQIVLPSALSAVGGTQLDNGSASPLSSPNVAPDFISKVAFDPSSRVHVEFGGIARFFKIYNTSTGQPTSGQTFSKTGGGGELNSVFEVAKGVRLIANNQLGDGIGRYFFGNALDLVVRSNGSLSPIHTFTTVEGVEATVKNTLLYFYFGGIYLGKNAALDANGTSYIGWGFPGAANSQNRSVNEYTFGLNQTLWKSPAYGAINLMLQYEFATRTPWYVAPGALDHANDHTVYFDFRYTLPGSAPPAK